MNRQAKREVQPCFCESESYEQAAIEEDNMVVSSLKKVRLALHRNENGPTLLEHELKRVGKRFNRRRAQQEYETIQNVSEIAESKKGSRVSSIGEAVLINLMTVQDTRRQDG